MSKIQLSENHRRKISVTMHLIEKLAVELENNINYDTELRMLNLVNDIPDEQKSHYRDIVTMIKKHITYMADKYDLEQNQQVQSRLVMSRKAKMWEILCDSKSRRMRGYGKFPEKHSKEYDADIDELMKLIEGI